MLTNFQVLTGNLTADPELRFTPSGAAVVNFRIAHTPRRFDRQSNEWKDGETLFINVTDWRERAENIAASLKKGTRVIVAGKLQSRTFETREGEKRTVIELLADEVGVLLDKVTVEITKTSNSGGNSGGYNNGVGNQGGGYQGSQGGGSGYNDEAPF